MTASRSTDGAPKLAAFQEAAVEHIVKRLSDKRGSQRFLLADEVGLGKTVVARGVIDALGAGQESLRVVYLCSNAEIAQQNRQKLVSSGGQSVGRATDLAYSQNMGGRVKKGSVQLFAFTPGTSLGGGTGLARERRMMLYLLDRCTSADCSDPDWQEFFRCSAGRQTWLESVSRSALAEEFTGKLSASVQAEFKKLINGTQYELFCKLENAVAEFNGTSTDKKLRSHLVGDLRKLLQRVTLELIQPDLVLLDEVQRFREVLDMAADAKNLSSVLLRSGTPVLILSATPYRMLTLNHEDDSAQHHEDFFNTLQFLLSGDRGTLEQIKSSFREFGERMKGVPLDGTRDERLLELKRSIEEHLRRIICRTERSWYYTAGVGALEEVHPGNGSFPSRQELQEFFDVHRGLAGQLDGVGHVTEFWKSAPSLLTFMDKQYALPKKLRAKRIAVPRSLVSSGKDSTLPSRNRRLKALIDHSLGTADELPMLWTKPTFTYHIDQTFGANPPRKMLVFSGWRFVPKAISVAVSNAASRRLKTDIPESSQPVRFADAFSPQALDLCLPSLALARLVNPLRALTADETLPSAADVISRAKDQVRRALDVHGISVSNNGKRAKLWEVILRLEQRLGNAELIEDALQEWTPSADSSAGFQLHVDRISQWVGGKTPLTVREEDVGMLAWIAQASPAVCLLRSLCGTYEDSEVRKRYSDIWSLCFRELRRYLNRRVVQQIVLQYRNKAKDRAVAPFRGYAGKLLTYSHDHHLQAVLDEHTHLKHSESSAVSSALAHYRNVWTLAQGKRRTLKSTSRASRILLGNRHELHDTQFALGFGDELEAEERSSLAGTRKSEAAPKLRRTEIREAFNSPFWPFVLATTSVGQEGLDFHLNCRDVFHWNLPSNPVDLEQREGRVNRRNGLAVRQSIAKDWPLTSVLQIDGAEARNPWQVLFTHLQNDKSIQRHKQGLYPNWIYECRNPRDTVCVARHVAFFEKSRDVERYALLKTRLALYRLVFGQVNQEHLLGNLTERLHNLEVRDQEAARRYLRGYMLNLSPVTRDVALRFARVEAQTLIAPANHGEMRILVDDVRKIAADNSADFSAVSNKLSAILEFVDGKLRSGKKFPARTLPAVAALTYVRNPYDAFFDTLGTGGFDDDVNVISELSETAFS